MHAKILAMENRYYYRHMNKNEQTAYEAMLAGFKALSPSIRVPRLPGNGLGDVFFRLRLDHPTIFYVTGCTYRWAREAEYAELLPVYMFEKQRIPEHIRALEARVEKLVRPAEKLSEVEKEQYIHDFICANVRYDKLKKPYSHEVIGPLQNGVGVCEGIAKTVKLLCDRLGLECVIAISEADTSRPGGYLHAWNVVEIGGKHYHLDATFDHTLGKDEETRYDYYNLDDKHIFRDHRPLLYPMPACTDGDNFYYKTAKLSWTKEEDVAKRVDQALRKKKESMIFHWRGGYLTREKLGDLMAVIGPAAAKREKGVTYAINWPQAVIKLYFTAPDAETVIETAQADEAALIDYSETPPSAENGGTNI